MTMSDGQKNQVARAFTLVARQFDLRGVDVQRMGMAFTGALDALEPGQPVELQALFDYLVKEQRISQIDALDFCIVLQARQDKIGVTFHMPLQAREVTPERIERVVNQFNKKTGQASYDRKTDGAPEAPAPRNTFTPPARGSGRSSRGLVIALMVVALAGAGFHAYRQANAGQALKEVPPESIPGVSACGRVLANNESVICDISETQWSIEKAPAVRAQALRLRESLAARGVTRVVVRVVESGKVVAMVP